MESYEVVSVLLVFLATWALKRFLAPKSSVSKLATPPGADLVWGHEKIVFDMQPGRAFRNWIEKCGLTFRIKAAFQAPDILVLCDPVGIEYLLQKRIYDYHHSDVVRPRVARFLGKGLGWVEGEDQHKRMKRLISPTLSAESIRAMSGDVRDAASKVLNNLTRTLESSDGCLQNIDILHWTAKSALNIVGHVAFLYEFDGGESQDAKDILKARRQGVTPMARYAGFMFLMLLRRFPILNDLPIPTIQAQGIAKKTIQNGVAREMVRRNRDFVDKDQRDLLTALLVASTENRISTEEVNEQISTFVMAGHEATTLTLGFTIWELTRNIPAQERLREELSRWPGEPTYDDYLTGLPYLDAILKETLRMYPGLTYMERVATKADAIPLKDPVILGDGQVKSFIEVSPGQTVLIPIIAIQRLDSVWKDGDTFRPERWLGDRSPEEKLWAGYANLLVFSNGPRTCIGFKLAIYVYKVVLSGLISRFRFEPTGDELSLGIASSLQPWLNGQMEKGPQIPVHIHAL
ncbi:cytochrome P450 [Mycena metata]|uniref:Cytochrome P450 n=1 Tax=Mycena metata TaxID=1033252 RepID=A0AAD7NKW7_9AGAR|nr:cytochrome P450 [Mycena metata]